MASNHQKKFIKISMLCFFLLFTLVFFSSLTVKQLPMIVGGRVAIENENEYIYSWPGVYFEAGFYGSSVEVHLNDSINMLNIVVDNNPPIVLNKPGKLIYAINNLTEGAHKIRLEKRTESYFATATFEGFFIPEFQQAILLEQPKRKIEFIGDSSIVGYGISSNSRKCTEKEVFLTTNTSAAFAALVANHFNAQYQINALSGLGIVRNYDGSKVDTSMLIKYPFVFNYNDIVYKADWSPQIIAIILGTNDFSTRLGVNEKWQSRADLQNDFVNTYEKFILYLREKHPRAKIILFSLENLENEVTTQISHVVKRLWEKGEKKLFFQVSDIALSKTGCSWHFSIEDHQQVASMIIEYFEKNQFWWN